MSVINTDNFHMVHKGQGEDCVVPLHISSSEVQIEAAYQMSGIRGCWISTPKVQETYAVRMIEGLSKLRYVWRATRQGPLIQYHDEAISGRMCRRAAHRREISADARRGPEPGLLGSLTPNITHLRFPSREALISRWSLPVQRVCVALEHYVIENHTRSIE